MQKSGHDHLTLLMLTKTSGKSSTHNCKLPSGGFFIQENK